MEEQVARRKGPERAGTGGDIPRRERGTRIYVTLSPAANTAIRAEASARDVAVAEYVKGLVYQALWGAAPGFGLKGARDGEGRDS